MNDGGSIKSVGAVRVTILLLSLITVAGLVTLAWAGNGVGGLFHLGRRNTVNQESRLVGDVPGSNLVIKNGGSGSALTLKVGETAPPLRVKSSKKVKHLNADFVDGRPAGPRGFALVKAGSQADTIYAREVNDVIYHADQSRYCFDLTFRPRVAVGSPHLNNNAVIATQVPLSASDGLACPEGYRDAAARVYGANDPNSTPRNDVAFSIFFE